MSESKKRPRTTPVSAEKTQPLKVDEDLLCLICTELVEDAKQVDCCGGLFCGACIDIWMNRQDDGHGQGCPQCRAALQKSNVVPDLRSERKSALQPRRCPFHEQHNCEFVGTRQEVAYHKRECPCDPNNCPNQQCRTNKEQVAHQGRLIEEYKKIITENSEYSKRQLALAAMMSPEDILKKAYGFSGVKIWTVSAEQEYTVSTSANPDRPTPHDVDIEIVDANCNATLFCYRPIDAMARLGVFPRLQITLTLISFNAVVDSCTKSITLESDLAPGRGMGIPNWLLSSTFKKYLKDGKFALGWKVAVLH